MKLVAGQYKFKLSLKFVSNGRINLNRPSFASLVRRARDTEENPREKKYGCAPGAREAIFSPRLSFASRAMDQAKKGPVVV